MLWPELFKFLFQERQREAAENLLKKDQNPEAEEDKIEEEEM